MVSSCPTDLHLVLELSSDTTSSLMPAPSTTTLPASMHPPPVMPRTSNSINVGPAVTNVSPAMMTAGAASHKQKPPRRIQLTTLK